MSDNDPAMTASAPTTTTDAPTAEADTTITTSDATDTGDAQTDASAAPDAEEITYHAVEKDGQISAIWEMQGRKHLRTIDPRSRQGQEILRLYTSEHHEQVASDE